MRSFSVGAMAAAGLAAIGSPAAAQGEIAPTPRPRSPSATVLLLVGKIRSQMVKALC